MKDSSAFSVAAGQALTTGRARSVDIGALARRHAPLVAVVLVALALGFVHLSRYPQTWFDEGIYLNVSRNVVDQHAYFARSADGTRDYAPIVGVGPTVLLPIALALRLVGMTLEAARFVPVLYLAAATGLLFGVARRLFGARAAVLTLAFALTLPALDWVAIGRQALGETAAFTCLLLGGVLALRAKSQTALALAGLTLGLAMVTKGQYLLILPPALVAIATIDRYDTRVRPIRWYLTLLIGALAFYTAWITALLLLMGPSHIAENVRLLRSASGGALIVFNVSRMLAACKLLLGPSSFLLAGPALLCGLFAIRRARAEQRLALLAIWSFAVLWLGWFTFASIAWPRYAFPGIALSAIFMGWFVSEALRVVPEWLAARLRIADRARTALAGAGVVALCAVLLAGAWVELSPLVRADQREPQRFAAALDASVPAGTVVDAWEPELGFLSDAALQYPPPGSLDKTVRARWLGQTTQHDFSVDLKGEYLVVGPFARWVGAYATALNSEQYVLVNRVGAYELYQLVRQ
jgi:4-amino-4-deoxy-L-arabinose transferase-like glycosyltransferase